MKPQRYRATLRGFLQNKLCATRHRCLGSGKFRKCSITIDDLLRLWDTQQGKCAISGIPMLHSYATSNNRELMCNVSIDRIDSKKDYTIDNIQLVCRNINFMKLDMKQEDFVWLCSQVSQHNQAPIALPTISQ